MLELLIGLLQGVWRITLLLGAGGFLLWQLNKRFPLNLSTKVIGDQAEHQVKKILKNLGGEYYAFHDIRLPSKENPSKTTQIDHLVISKYGIFVIETKNYVGYIHGESRVKEWIQEIGNKTHPFFSPVKQNEIHVRAVKDVIGEKNIPTYSIVAFSTRADLTNVNVPELTTSVVYIPRLKSVLQSMQLEVLSEREVMEYIRKISSAQIQPKSTKEPKWALIKSV